MPAIAFPLNSTPGERPAEGQGRLANVYATKEGDAPVWKQTAGLATWGATAAQSGFRGAIQVGSLLYVAWADKACTYSSTGVETVLTGTLSGSGPVTWAQNNKSPTPDIVCVDRDNGAFSVTSAAVTSFADPDLPTPNSVSFLDGYFLFTIGDGRMFATGLNGVTVDALAFAKCEAKPDGLTRGFVSGDLFYGMGPASTEIWQNVATTPFPLGRAKVVSVGIRGPWCVAGDQIGWDGAPIFVAADGTVRRWNGYQTQTISTPAVVRDILAVADVNTIRASVYVAGGQSIWSLTSAAWTWEFNTTTGAWHQRVSLGRTDWRARGAVLAFDRWLCGDVTLKTIWQITQSALREGLVDIPRVIESAPSKAFPARVPIYRADFDFIVGQGSETGIDPIQTAPSVRISWSDDGANTWSTPVTRALGRQGQYSQRVSIAPVGMTGQAGRRWRIEFSDPVYVSLLGGTFNERLSAR